MVALNKESLITSRIIMITITPPSLGQSNMRIEDLLILGEISTHIKTYHKSTPKGIITKALALNDARII